MGQQEEIGDRIRQKREERGLSQSAFAEAMKAAGHKWSQSAVWEVETGKRNLRFTEGAVAARLLGVSMAWLAGEPDSRDLYAEGYSDCLDTVQNSLTSLKTIPSEGADRG